MYGKTRDSVCLNYSDSQSNLYVYYNMQIISILLCFPLVRASTIVRSISHPISFSLVMSVFYHNLSSCNDKPISQPISFAYQHYFVLFFLNLMFNMLSSNKLSKNTKTIQCANLRSITIFEKEYNKRKLKTKLKYAQIYVIHQVIPHMILVAVGSEIDDGPNP